MNKQKIAQQMEVMIDRSLTRSLYVVEKDENFLVRNMHNNTVIVKNIHNYDLADFLCRGLNTVNEARQIFAENKVRKSWTRVCNKLDKLFNDRKHYEYVLQESTDTEIKEPLRHRLHTVEQDIEKETEDFVRQSNNVFYLFKN